MAGRQWSTKIHKEKFSWSNTNILRMEMTTGGAPGGLAVPAPLVT
jgi:hypothetical protein